MCFYNTKVLILLCIIRIGDKLHPIILCHGRFARILSQKKKTKVIVKIIVNNNNK